MKYRKTNQNQLTAVPKRCIRGGEMTIFTCTKIKQLLDKPLCPRCELALLVAERDRMTVRRINKQTKPQTKKRTNRRGSNQYQTRHRSNWLLLTIMFLLGILLYLMLAGIFTPKDDKSLARQAEAMTIISPLPSTASPSAVTATPTPSVAQAEPTGGEAAEIVREIFGEHADKAFAVLKCENSSLNPKAVNTAGNTPAGSRDIGVFQINEYWQGVHSKFLFDARTNITMAWQIYRDSGYSFKMWTCGRNLGL